ncbi:MAG TPA: SPOR domain-containing protein [Pyrinomonadaceae bacterium]|nr:SPOR domain-containing protein [Pyrinomonadaceae bacterium]
MELKCPVCGAKIEGAAGACDGARATACAACGAGASGARRARGYDGYAVGRRLLRLAPVWLLLIAVGFALALLLFSWLGRRAEMREGDAFINEATNRAPAADGADVKGSEAKSPHARTDAAAATARAKPAEEAAPAAPAAPSSAPSPQGLGEAEAYTVQVGAFATVSDANEQVSRLRAAGFEARVAESDASTRFRFQVRSGLYATREEAATLAARLRTAGVAAQTVIVEPEKK